jgi:hypothetical protein
MMSLSKAIPAALEERADETFCPGNSDLAKMFPPPTDIISPEIETAKGIKNGRFFIERPPSPLAGESTLCRFRCQFKSFANEFR